MRRKIIRTGTLSIGFFAAILMVLMSAAGVVAGDSEAGEKVSSPVDASSLNYVTEDYFPYNYIHDGKVDGYSVALLRLVWEEMGASEGKISVYPWARGYEMLRNEPGTVLFCVSRSPEREDMFKWACPITVVRFVLISKKNRGIQIEKADDLRGYVIGTVRDDIAETVLMGMQAGLNIESVADMKANLDKLNLGRVDLVAYEEGSIDKCLLKNGYDPEEYETVFLVNESAICYAMHRDMPDEFVKRFQAALDKVRQGEAFARLRSKYFD